jgi:hypothetical protein
MKYGTLTLNQAKMHINEFLLEKFGLKSEKLTDMVDASKDSEELRGCISRLAKATNSDIAGELVVLWRDIASGLKNGSNN